MEMIAKSTQKAFRVDVLKIVPCSQIIEARSEEAARRKCERLEPNIIEIIAVQECSEIYNSEELDSYSHKNNH